MLFEKQIIGFYKQGLFTRCDDTGLTHYFSHDDFPDMAYRPYYFKSSMGHTLRGYFYWYPQPKPGRLIVFDHGFGGGHRAYMKEIELNIKLIDEVWEKYGHHKSFQGWYLSQEVSRRTKNMTKIYAEVVGYGNSCDAHHFTAPRPDGVPASRAIKQALDEAQFDAEKDLLYINAHGTGTPLNDAAETKAIKLAMGEEAAKRAKITSTKSITGHMLGATGAVELIASALSLYHGIVTPTIGLTNPDPECDLDYTPNVARKADVTVAISNSLGFGGHNGCVAVRKWIE
mgnify:CR=1 FL=1